VTAGRESTREAPVLRCAFYSVCDSRHFLGLVALLNSLRFVGHDEPFFLVDAGLTDEQRRLIQGHVTTIPAPPSVPPMFLTPLGPLQHPARVAVALDADIIVTRALNELIDDAEAGRLVAFVNNAPNDDRFFAAWGSALGLGPLRRQPYLAAGQLFIPAALNRRVLELWSDLQAKVPVQWTRYGGARLSDPFYFADMDVFNAIVAARLDLEELSIVEHRLAPNPPFTGVRLVDEECLLCAYADGMRPFFLHHILAKPWLRATRRNLYSMLLPRLLLAADVTVRLEPHHVPLRLRRGRLAAADRLRAHVQAATYWYTRRQLGRFGIRTRIAARRRRTRNDAQQPASRPNRPTGRGTRDAPVETPRPR
jgi:hypothetical protein